MSFTRAGAYEARDRALRVIPGLSNDDLSWFRTIHSACFRLLGLKREMVAAGGKLREFAEAYSYELSAAEKEETDVANYEVTEVMLKTVHDYMLFFENWRRNKMFPTIEKAFGCFMDPEDWPAGWTLAAVTKFHDRYLGWKTEKGYVDFTDMLQMAVKEQAHPDLDVLILDEAQDDSPLQAAVVNMWSCTSGCHLLYLGGDPDQAIFVFQGADPGLMLSWPAARDVTLMQSYRVPAAVHRVALKLIRMNQDRVDVDYKPRLERGEVHLCDRDVVPLEDLEKEGSVFILARNRYLLEDVHSELVAQGIPFYALRGKSPLTKAASNLVHTGFSLSSGRRVSLEAAAKLLNKIPSKGNLVRGAKKQLTELAGSGGDVDVSLSELERFIEPNLWFIMTDKSSPEGFMPLLGLDDVQTAYYSRLLQHRGLAGLLAAPKIRTGTIHSVKGAEATSVVIRPEMAWKTFKEFDRVPEGERRVWYVGLTRAKKNLYLLNPEQDKAFDWRKIA